MIKQKELLRKLFKKKQYNIYKKQFHLLKVVKSINHIFNFFIRNMYVEIRSQALTINIVLIIISYHNIVMIYINNAINITD